MYEEFGAKVDDNNVGFSLFFPGGGRYVRGSGPTIRSIGVVGDFQEALGGQNWSSGDAVPMEKEDRPDGSLFRLRIRRPLPEGYYHYRYFVTFENGSRRLCADPCSKLGGRDHESSAFVIGETGPPVEPLVRALPFQDMIIYEMHVADFTGKIRNGGAPFDAVRSKLDYLCDLGVNAIQFMPLSAWGDSSFSWGYDPTQLFSVEFNYVNDACGGFGGLTGFRLLLSEIHRRGIMVLFDGVFNHVRVDDAPGLGFPYFWLYQDPADSPFVGEFGSGGFFRDLDFNNACTQELVADVCRYWLHEYRIDAIRLDYSRGYLDRNNLNAGVPRLCADIAARSGENNGRPVEVILEHLTDDRYDAIAEVNTIAGATGCWFDPLMYELRAAAASGRAGTGLLRALDAAKDFDPGKWPVIYADNHDHSSLIHAVGGKSVWWRAQPCLIALFTAPGAVLLYQGAEMGIDLSMPDHGNGRVLPRPLDWKQLETDPGDRIHRLLGQLIFLRKSHPALRSRNLKFDKMIVANPGIYADNGVVIFHRWSGDRGGTSENILVALNFSDKDRPVAIPFPCPGTWKDLLNNSECKAKQGKPVGLKIASNWGGIYRLMS
jgi:pullulanase